MNWLELRTKSEIYDNGWKFGQSIWTPTRKEDDSRWPFYYMVEEVKKGDIIFHLREIAGSKRFVGYSTADSDGYLTYANPTRKKHDWNYSKAFYKVDLVNYRAFDKAILLSDFFTQNDKKLRDYYASNNKRQKKEHLFYNIKNSKLECLMGAYFSEFDDVLCQLLIRNTETTLKKIKEKVHTGVTTGAAPARIGQKDFSDNVKDNFDHKCCYPNCKVDDVDFLVGSHIARWADNEELRGNTNNGLCFCLHHDRAFEKGFFTLNSELKVAFLDPTFDGKEHLKELLINGYNQTIKQWVIAPSIESLKQHWNRIGFKNN